MANPNIVNTTAIYANTTGRALLASGTTTIVSNASSSGKVFFVETLIVSNTDASNAVTVTVQQWNNATPGATGATGFSFCSSASVPPASSLVVLAKDAGATLLEDQSISVTPGTGAKLDVNCGYKEIS